MSHTLRGESTIFHHNGDYSGDVAIVVAEDRCQIEDGYVKVNIEFDDIKELVANYVRDELISNLEQSDAHSILFSF